MSFCPCILYIKAAGGRLRPLYACCCVEFYVFKVHYISYLLFLLLLSYILHNVPYAYTCICSLVCNYKCAIASVIMSDLKDIGGPE